MSYSGAARRTEGTTATPLPLLYWRGKDGQSAGSAAAAAGASGKIHPAGSVYNLAPLLFQLESGCREKRNREARILQKK